MSKFANQKAGPSGRPMIRRYRRFSGYDYSRGASLFLTFTLECRFPAFGNVVGDRVEPSPAGAALQETVFTEIARHPFLVIRSMVVMPDHVHMRVTIAPGSPRPLVDLGRFIANIKRWAKWKAAKLGVAIEWQQSCHDRICNSREINELVDKYIANNPLKWGLMHGPNPPMKVVEPFDSPRLLDGEWWTAVGNSELFSVDRPVAALRLSRKIPEAHFGEVIRRCLDAANKGYVAASTFISPCERKVMEALVEVGAPLIRAVPDALATVYRPKGDEPRQFADGRLLLLSRVAAPGNSRSEAWHGINDALGEASLANGVSLYVTRNGDKLDWRFEQ